jgi:hypothetical protein
MFTSAEPLIRPSVSRSALTSRSMLTLRLGEPAAKLVPSLESQLAAELRRRGLTDEGVRALGKLGDAAFKSGESEDVVRRAIRQAVRSTGGESGEAVFKALLRKIGRSAIPGIGLVFLAFEVAQAMDAGAAGGGKLLQTEARIGAQSRIRELLRQGDPQNQLRGLIGSAPGALLEMAQLMTRFAELGNLAALRKGLPLIAKLAAAGVPEALQTLQTLGQAKDTGLAAAAKSQLRSLRPASQAKVPRAPQQPKKPVNELPPSPGLQPLPPLKTELPPLRIDPQALAAQQARKEQVLQQGRKAFLGRLNEQARGSQVANNATLSDWVRSESPEQLANRVQEIAQLLKGKPVGNVYEYHTDANGKPVPESRNPNYNQYLYGGVMLKVSDLNYLRTSLERYVATLKKAQTPVPGAPSPTGAWVKSPGKTLAGQAARDREAQLMEQGRQKAIEILKTLTPSPWSSQTYEQMLADAIASSQSDPYTAFWLAALGQPTKPGPSSPTASGNAKVADQGAKGDLPPETIKEWAQGSTDPKRKLEVSLQVREALAKAQTCAELYALAKQLPRSVLSLPLVSQALARLLQETLLPAMGYVVPTKGKQEDDGLRSFVKELRLGTAFSGTAHELILKNGWTVQEARRILQSVPNTPSDRILALMAASKVAGPPFAKGRDDAVALIMKVSNLHREQAECIYDYCHAKGLVVAIRPLNAAHASMQPGQQAPKPAYIKAKSETKDDQLLGIKNGLGFVTYRKEKFTKAEVDLAVSLHPDRADALRARAAKRNAETDLLKADVQRLIDSGLVTLDANGLLRDNRKGSPTLGKPFGPDVDGFAVYRASTGAPIRAYEPDGRRIDQDLARSPLATQHGAHMQWLDMMVPLAAGNPEAVKRSMSVFLEIVQEHANSEPVVVIMPGGAAAMFDRSPFAEMR